MKMTENELGLLFQKILAEDKKVFKFDMLFEEIESLQGIPDYIGIRIKTIYDSKKVIDKIDYSNWSVLSKILSALNQKSFHTVSYIQKRTGLYEGLLKKELSSLCRKQIIKKGDGELYKISKDFEFPVVSIFSFELKLHDWKRALFQALRYKLFSEYTYIVMPSCKRTILQKNIELFQCNNIGVVLLDTKKKQIEILHKAKKNKEISQVHLCYMTGCILKNIESKKCVSSSVEFAYKGQII